MALDLWPIETSPFEELFHGRGLMAHADYQDRPVDWIVRVLGVPEETLRWSLAPEYRKHAWDGTADPLVAVCEGLAEWRDVGVESGTGTGKSFLAACLVLWFLACHEGARVYTYAPKEDQLRLFMWSEISYLWPRFQQHFPTAKLSDLRIRMDGVTDQWAAHGYAVKIRAGEKSATGAQGAHAEHMLLITEETPGIDGSVMEAIRNTKGADHNLQLALGNPDSQHDELHKFCERPGVLAVRVSALDHPNVVTGRPVVPGATGRKSVKDRLEEYGEDNRLYQSRVRGISPDEPVDALIRMSWIREAVDRYLLPQFRDGPLALGVDVAASESGDLGAIARWSGACLLNVNAFPCPDPTQLGVDVGVEIQQQDIDVRRVGVDVVGVGEATVGRLREMGLKVQALNAGSKPDGSADREAIARVGHGVYSPADFANKRAQMWYQLRIDLQRGHIALPDDPELHEDLTTPLWFTRNGKIFVEPKEEIRKRLGRSPNKGDAVVMGNWVRSRPKYEKPAKPKSNPNVDLGLEKLMKRLNQRQRRAG